MEIINTIVGTPLGYVMRFCYRLLNNYGLAIILFTLITKIIMFPISLLVQKNSIKMVKMKPELDALRYQYVDDKDAYVDAQSALYKKEKYSPMAGVWPLLLQLPIIFGLLDVVYKPLKPLLHISADTASAFVARAAEISGMTVADLGSTAQLTAVNLVKENAAKFADIPGADAAIEAIKGLNTNVLGIDLTQTPSISPVSYTHLDVYKRQILIFAYECGIVQKQVRLAEICVLKEISRAHCRGDIVCFIIYGILDEFDVGVFIEKPVSYTHLLQAAASCSRS